MAETNRTKGSKTAINTKTNTGGATGKGFDVSGQPDPELKRKGWEKFRIKKAIRDTFFDFAEMSLKQLESIAKDMKEHPEKWTVTQYKTVQYLLDGKLKVDFMNRGLSYAPSKVEAENTNLNTDVNNTVEDGRVDSIRDALKQLRGKNSSGE